MGGNIERAEGAGETPSPDYIIDPVTKRCTFQKGNKLAKGNPLGPAMNKFRGVLLKAVEADHEEGGKSNLEQIVENVISQAVSGDRWATELVWPYLFGKPTEMTEGDGGGKPPIQSTSFRHRPTGVRKRLSTWGREG